MSGTSRLKAENRDNDIKLFILRLRIFGVYDNHVLGTNIGFVDPSTFYDPTSVFLDLVNILIILQMNTLGS